VSVKQPIIPVEIFLGGPLRGLATSEGVARETGRRLDALASELGIPGHVAVEASAVAGERPVAISVRGVRLEYPRSLDQRVLAGWRSRRGAGETGNAALPSWEDEVAADGAGAVAELAVHAIGTRASLLLGAAQVSAWCEGAGIGAPASIAGLHPTGEVLRTVLDLRIGIRDRERVASLIAQSGAATPADAAEYVIDGVRPATVDVRVEPGYLEEITTAGARPGGSIFPYLRDSLYVELGLRLPRLRLIPARELAPRCFAFRVNDIATPVVVGLPAQTCLVSAPSARLAEMTPGVRAALNPEGDVPAAFVPEAMREELERQGYTTWDSPGHLALALAETARLHARALIDRKTVTHELDLLGRLLPALVRSVQAKVPLSRLTRLIRSLLDERVSVRDLPHLLQALVDQAETSGLPESDAELLAVARRAARPAITRAAMVQGSVYAYLLDPSFEAGAAAPEVSADKLVQEVQRSLVEALDNELTRLPSTVTPPVLLTNSGARLPVRRAIAAAWPRMPVLAYDELDAMVNVMPVTRLYPARP
jgi:hypothetical protein